MQYRSFYITENSGQFPHRYGGDLRQQARRSTGVLRSIEHVNNEDILRKIVTERVLIIISKKTLWKFLKLLKRKVILKNLTLTEDSEGEGDRR